MELTSPTLSQRIVPGAPPSVEKVATAKKKRKTKAKGAEPTDLPPPATDQLPPVASIPSEVKPTTSSSPTLELLHKRTRNYTKKIQRIKEYLSKPESSLNDDQRKAVATLPQLEFAVQEFEELKRALEPIESNQVIQQQAALETAVKDAQFSVLEASSAKEADIIAKIPYIIALTHLDISSVTATESEKLGLQSLSHTLMDKESADSQTDILHGLLSGKGEYEGLTYIRLLEMVSEPDTAEPNGHVPDEVVAFEDDVEDATTPPANVETIAPEDVVVQSDPVIISSLSPESGLGGSFHFMQASELEDAAVIPTHGWMGQESTGAAAAVSSVAHDVEAAPVHIMHEESAPLAPPPVASETLDWAADDADGLEPLKDLEEEFGASPALSGNATPVENPLPAAAEAQPTAANISDGFTSVGRRGFDRGGFRGDRGRGRGAPRGGRGGWRGEHSGEFRGGRGKGVRGGGDRGGFRGSPRGRPTTEANL